MNSVFYGNDSQILVHKIIQILDEDPDSEALITKICNNSEMEFRNVLMQLTFKSHLEGHGSTLLYIQ